MSKIEFLSIVINQEVIPQIIDLFDRFQQKTGIAIDPSFVGWDTIWRELVNIGIYRRGADVTEVGTTWLDSLVGMNALRPFSSTEIDRLGGESAYIPATWSATSFGGDGQVWGIPIRCDVRVIWYWKDMLEQAGVDPDTAFESIPKTQETLEKLKSVIPTPFGVATIATDPNSIQALASWLWASGGDFVTPNCDKVLLMEPEALEALHAYFGLYRYMSKSGIGFARRNVAVFVGGPWLLLEIPDEDRASLGIAIPPGPPFIGGTVLSIWQHATRNRRVDNAFKFVEFMVRPEVQVEYCPHLGLLPTRLDAWELPSMVDHPYYEVMRQALSIGRGLPAVPLWGMVEEKLLYSISLIWEDLRTNPEPDVDRAIERYLEPTVTRLNLSLR